MRRNTFPSILGEKAKRRLHIQFLYWEGCPSHEEALQRLKEALRLEGVEANVEIIHIGTEEEAQKWAFIGSPTVRIEGEDIQPPPKEIPFRLTCRVYRLENGRVSPLPSTNMLRQALRRALKGRGT